MFLNTAVWIKVMLAILIAFVVSFALTPVVKILAQKLGAMDVPGEARRVHDHPIPRMGGLAIFLGFIVSMLLFADITQEVRGILLGSIIIVITGVIDDIISLRAWTKFLIQILAAVIAVLHGVVINVVSNPNVFSSQEAIVLGWVAIPITVLWIVGITNSVNLIDGLDGLAVGVSTISCVTILVVALLVSEPNVALIVAALAGACIGFMPYNLNPARIFMGDTGSLLLGYVLATVSVLGLFKFYAIVTFVVPVLALAVPLSDTLFAFCRRILHGQSPFHADRGHFHHKLMDLGLNQKQAVAILYAISATLARRRRAHDEGHHPHRAAHSRAADRLCRVRLHPQERAQAPHRRGTAGGTGRSGRAGGCRSGRTGKRRRSRRNACAGGQR
ncbi:MAG: glycosyltransferase family 4 protein [Oscillospiraceae bacterium]